mgnify:FL=1
MTKLVQSSPDKRQDVFAEIMHPEITKAMEAADAEPNADNLVPMPTADPEQFKTYQVPDESIHFAVKSFHKHPTNTLDSPNLL